MTRITPIKENDKLIGFKCDGHANYSRWGNDIVCAAISVLTINTINSLEAIAHKQVCVWEEDGYIEYRIRGKPSAQSNILLECAQLGYEGIAEQYPDNVRIESW